MHQQLHVRDHNRWMLSSQILDCNYLAEKSGLLWKSIQIQVSINHSFCRRDLAFVYYFWQAVFGSMWEARGLNISVIIKTIQNKPPQIWFIYHFCIRHICFHPKHEYLYTFKASWDTSNYIFDIIHNITYKNTKSIILLTRKASVRILLKNLTCCLYFVAFILRDFILSLSLIEIMHI